MKFDGISKEARELLGKIVKAENPSDFLYKCFDDLSSKEDNLFRQYIKELCHMNCIRVMWADNRPYHVFVNESMITSRGILEGSEDGTFETSGVTIINNGENNSISIGSGNKIINSQIGNSINTKPMQSSKNFFEQHPFLCSLFISLIAGFILLFSFWSNIVRFIEGVF